MKAPYKKFFITALTIAWVGLSIYWVSLLHAGHLLAFENKIQPNAISSLISDQKKWTMIHIFAPKCRCSEFLLKELSARAPLSDTQEVVVTLGAFPEAEILRAKGYEVVQKSIEQLKTEEKVLLEGVPFFIIAQKDHTVAYAGGYADEKINPNTKLKYLEIFADLQAGHTVATLAVKGCPVSEKYQRMLNPFGLNYNEKEPGEKNERLPSSVQ
ncbi:MAG: hypothetical protein H7256_11270 [Bdellovibrio sp.]|nr:hypothetical protein [Bdellovibrio sp.]